MRKIEPLYLNSHTVILSEKGRLVYPIYKIPTSKKLLYYKNSQFIPLQTECIPLKHYPIFIKYELI